MKQFVILISFCVFPVAFNLALSPENNFVISPLVKASVNHVLKVADSEQSSSKNPENLLHALRQTGKLLDKSTIAWARKNEGSNLQAKVVYLALTLPSQEEQLKEVYDYYFKNGAEMYYRERDRETTKSLNLGARAPLLKGFKPHILLGPTLRGEHVTEKYRPVWEGLALLRSFESSLDRNSDTLMDALARIGNPNSASILGYRSLPAWQAKRATSATARDEFYTLAALPSQTTLHVLLDTLAKWQTERPVLPVPPVKARSGIPGLTDEGDSGQGSQGSNWKRALATACEALEYRCRERKEVSDSWKVVFADFPSDEVVPSLAEIFEQLEGSTRK